MSGLAALFQWTENCVPGSWKVYRYLVFLVADGVHQSCLVDYLDCLVDYLDCLDCLDCHEGLSWRMSWRIVWIVYGLDCLVDCLVDYLVYHYLVFLVADSVHQSCLVDYLDWVVLTELAGLRFAGGGQVNEGIAAGSGVQQPVVNIGPGKTSKFKTI